MALILGGDGTITGNPDITLTESVSIAGTITYEDVTNIDSVGVITARSGLDVGPLAGIAVTISSSGFIKTTSFIQADRTSASQAAFVVNLNGAQKARINADGSAKFGGILPNSPKIEFDENGSIKLTDKITSSSSGTFLTSQFTGICTDVAISAFYGFSSLNSQTGAIIKAQYNQSLGADALLWEGVGLVGGSFQQTSHIKPDGSSSFAAGAFAIESDGDISTNVRCHGHIELDSTGVFTTPKIKLFSNTGNATFAGNITLSTSGSGIDFSATGDGSGTATSELLDDYEEGTFTPTYGGQTTSGTYTYGNNIGYYTKVGRVVYFRIVLVNINTSSAGTGNMLVSGLPYTSQSSSSFECTPPRFDGFTFTADWVLPVVNNNATDINFYRVNSGQGDTALQVTAKDSDTSDMFVAGFYFTS